MDHKDIRKQIRNVLKEEGSTELLKLTLENSTTIITQQLALIEQKCLAQLDGMNKRSRAIQGFLMGEVKNSIEPRTIKVEDKMDALLEILTESGLMTAEVVSKLAAKTEEVAARKAAEKGAEIQARLEQQRAEQEAAAQQKQEAQSSGAQPDAQQPA